MVKTAARCCAAAAVVITILCFQTALAGEIDARNGRIHVGEMPALPNGATFPSSQIEAGNTNGDNTAVFGVVNPRGHSFAFPTAVTAYGELKAQGGQVFGIYAPVYGQASGVWTNEIDTFDLIADSPLEFPWNRGAGTKQSLGIAITCGFGGPFVNAACMEIGREGSTRGRGRFGIVVGAGAVLGAALMVDASEHDGGAASDLILRHLSNSRGATIELQTVGGTSGEPVIRHFDAQGKVTFEFDDNGLMTASGIRTVFRTPSSSHDHCEQGESFDDEKYHYVCVSRNHIRRVALNDF